MRALRLSLVMCSLWYAAAAFAADPQIEVSQSVYSYTSSTSESKATAASKTKDAAFVSMPSDLEISVRAEKWEFTVFPTQPGANFEVLNELMPHMELGFNFGYNHQTHEGDDGKKSNESCQFGPLVEYEIASSDEGVEFELRLDSVRSNTKDATSTTVLTNGKAAETSSSGYETELKAMYFRRLTDNLKVGAGLGYTYAKSTEKIAGVDVTSSEFAVTLLQLRMGIY